METTNNLISATWATTNNFVTMKNNNFAIAIAMTFVMNTANNFNAMTIYYTKTTALFSTETVKQEL